MRPADVIGNAIKVTRIATGEQEEVATKDGKDQAAVSLGRKGGRARRRKCLRGGQKLRSLLQRSGGARSAHSRFNIFVLAKKV